MEGPRIDMVAMVNHVITCRDLIWSYFVNHRIQIYSSRWNYSNSYQTFNKIYISYWQPINVSSRNDSDLATSHYGWTPPASLRHIYITVTHPVINVTLYVFYLLRPYCQLWLIFIGLIYSCIGIVLDQKEACASHHALLFSKVVN